MSASAPEILITTPLTKWLELEFCDAVTVFPNAMSFADADNDGMSEFVVGSIQGELYIFKGLFPKYWKKASDLGMITVVGAGDIMQKKKNVVYAVTGEGNLYTFILTSGHVAYAQRDLDLDATRAKDSGSRPRTVIEPYFTQKIPPNIIMSVLADIDGDGYPEILFGMTDRVVRSFKWVEFQNGSGGAFVTMNKWEFAGQIGNLSSALSDGVAQIFVSQPGGSCCRLKACPSLGEPEINFEPPVYHSPSESRTRNPLMQTHILGGISFDEPSSRSPRTRQNSSDRGKNVYAICSFDGSLIVCNENTVLWELQTCEHLIAMQPLPLRDEFVMATRSGAVYVVNDRKKMLKLLTPESMNGFTSGLYGMLSRQGVCENTCAFAATCSGGRIFIYYDLQIPCLASLPSFWRRTRSTVPVKVV